MWHTIRWRLCEFTDAGRLTAENTMMEIDISKPLEFSPHAQEKMLDRGASESEVRAAIRTGNPEPARKGRTMSSPTAKRLMVSKEFHL